jgi:hypothetical protein
MKSAAKHAGRLMAAMVPAAVVLRLGVPALAAAVFLAVLVLGVACWVISSDDRSDRVTRIIYARHGDAKCLIATPPSPHSFLAPGGALEGFAGSTQPSSVLISGSGTSQFPGIYRSSGPAVHR